MIGFVRVREREEWGERDKETGRGSGGRKRDWEKGRREGEDGVIEVGKGYKWKRGGEREAIVDTPVFNEAGMHLIDSTRLNTDSNVAFCECRKRKPRLESGKI